MLEYDNNAFNYFALTVLVIYLLPGTWYAVSELSYALLGSGEVGAAIQARRPAATGGALVAAQSTA